MNYYTYGSALVQNWPDDAIADINAFLEWVGGGCEKECPDRCLYIYDNVFDGDMDTLMCSGIDNIETRQCTTSDDGRCFDGALLIFSEEMFCPSDVVGMLAVVARKYAILPDSSAVMGYSQYADACLADDVLMPGDGGTLHISCLGVHDPCRVMPAKFLDQCLQDWGERALDSGSVDPLEELLREIINYMVISARYGGDLQLLHKICDFVQDPRLTPELAGMDARELSWLKQAAALAVHREEHVNKVK